jgi:cholesterol oxidase
VSNQKRALALRPDPRLWDDPRWPAAVRDDLPTLVEDGYRRAAEMLRPTPLPADFPDLPKLRALHRDDARPASMNPALERSPPRKDLQDLRRLSRTVIFSEEWSVAKGILTRI